MRQDHVYIVRSARAAMRTEHRTLNTENEHEHAKEVNWNRISVVFFLSFV